MANGTDNPVTRSQARSRTLIAQLASAGLVLGAVAIGFAGLPEPSDPTSVQPIGNDPLGNDGGSNPNTNPGTSKGTDDQNSDTSIDTIGLAMRLSMLDNAPEIQDQEPSEDPETSIVEDTPTDDDSSTIRDRVSYIGFIKDAQNPHAFIRIDGKQRVVTRGGTAKSGDDELPDLLVEKVTPRQITLSNGKIRSVIQLSQRSGASVTMIGGGQVEVAAVAETGSMLTEEDERRIAAMPARQQPLARRRLERERRGLPPDKVRRRKQPEPQVTVKASFNKKKPDPND